MRIKETYMTDKAQNKISWKIAADRLTIGEKVELKTFPGYWIQPRRYSKAGEAEILAVVTRQQIKKASVKKAIMAAAKEEELKGQKEQSDIAQMNGEALSDELRERILTAVVEDMSAEDIAGIEKQVTEIAYGVHAHNFYGEPVGGSTDWARSLLEYKDIFNEILKIVEEKNAPLPSLTSPSSATSLTGSSTILNSTKDVEI